MLRCAVLIHSRVWPIAALVHTTQCALTLSSTQKRHKLLQCRESGFTEPCMLLPPGLLATMQKLQAFACGVELDSQGKTKLPAALVGVTRGSGL